MAAGQRQAHRPPSIAATAEPTYTGDGTGDTDITEPAHGEASHADSAAPCQVRADGSLMTRALINLLSNTVKYSLTHPRVEYRVHVDPYSLYRITTWRLHQREQGPEPTGRASSKQTRRVLARPPST
ncbi:hypothetical protein [Mycetohabitans sp. B3]|uniref:hypothetical protein n=1 Tax=Mycetohabitans sp. B3 TaxID=2841841 RepID=UPI001F2B87D8|nr:hypothetical protein [Mycetohabitans sp. B3]MCF2134713.1 hypothetical protein [Mycetohabitans sp. B3]